MSNILKYYLQIEPRLFNFLLNNSWQLCCLSILIFIFLGLKYRSKPLFSYYLYSIILIKMILPPFVFLPTIKTKIPKVIIDTIQIASNDDLIVPNNFEFNYKSVFLFFWLLGILFGFSYLVLNFVKLLKVAKRSPSFNISTLGFLLEKLNLYDKVTVKISSEITTPLVFGIMKFTILLPSNANSWTNKELELVLCHELAHIKRKDTYAILIQNSIKIVYFYHPLVWIISKKMDMQREKLCDYKAINILGISKNNYVNTLYNSIKNLFTSSSSNYLLVNNLSHSGVALKERFNFLLKFNKKSLKLKIIEKLMIVFFVITIFFLSANYSNKVIVPQNSTDFFSAYIKPTIIGGNKEIYNHLKYPKRAKEESIGGRVLLKFICNTKGKVQDVKIIKESPIGYGFGEASKKALQQVIFKPGKDKNGNYINVLIHFPLSFKIK